MNDACYAVIIARRLCAEYNFLKIGLFDCQENHRRGATRNLIKSQVGQNQLKYETIDVM